MKGHKINFRRILTYVAIISLFLYYLLAWTTMLGTCIKGPAPILSVDPEIAAHLGEVLWALGRRDEAKRTWQEAAKAHPGNEVLAEVIKRFAP